MAAKEHPRKRRKITRSEKALWSDPESGVKVTEDDLRAGADPKGAESALDALATAIQNVKSQETKTHGYARAIQSTARCIGVGIRRRKVAEVIMANLPGAHGYARKEDRSSAGTGPAARYVALARWELRRWRKGELKVDSKNPVTLMGKTFHSPVMALEANLTSFRQVYLAWRMAVTPEAERAKFQAPEKVSEALAQALVKFKVVIRKRDGSLLRVHVGRDAAAMIELARQVLAHPLLQGALTPNEQKRVKTQLEEKAQELQAKAG